MGSLLKQTWSAWSSFISSLLSAMISSSSCAFLFPPIFFPLCFLFCGVGSQYIPWLRNLVCRLVIALTYPHCRETDEVSGKVVTEKSLSYMVMVPGKATHCHCCSLRTFSCLLCISFSCVLKSLSGSFSVFYRRLFHLVAVTFNCEYRDFLILTIVNSSLWSFFSTLF